MQHLFTREHAKLAIRIERKKDKERERIFVLICIKSIPFWRQFEDWNTNFELSTWDTRMQWQGEGAVAAVACLTLSGQRSQSALNWPIGVGKGRRSRGKGQQHQRCCLTCAGFHPPPPHRRAPATLLPATFFIPFKHLRHRHCSTVPQPATASASASAPTSCIRNAVGDAGNAAAAEAVAVAVAG